MKNILLVIGMGILVSQHIKMDVSSANFKNYQSIPAKYTCEGEDVNPALNIKDIPTNAKSLAMVMYDPDAPGKTFNHWVVWNIPPAETIPENASTLGVSGMNSAGLKGYKGPCPPSGTHHYHFKVFALDQMLSLQEGSSRLALERAMKGHTLAEGELVGLYQKGGNLTTIK
jgi:Raf kinase inhibitor-like YbhB/YbcL family protein